MSISGNPKPRLLITEDDIENQRLLQFVLRNKFDIDICDSEESFFNKLNEKDFDAVLMDVTLKGSSNGVEIIKDLRKKTKFKNIPVVCLSAKVFGEDRREAREAGIDAYLTKPVDNSLLINTLTKLINKNTN